MGATILVVDDNQQARAQVRSVLEACGLDLQIKEANEQETALALALRGDIDIVLTEMHRPNIDGMALVRAVRAQRDSISLPMILLAAADDEKTRAMSFEAGANDYLYKPFSPTELVVRIQVQLRLKNLQDELRRTNERHRRLGTHDELTGLANRRHLLEQCRRELARSRRHKFAMSVCALGVDHFRQVNSRVGFLAGDAIITELGQLLERGLRTPDLLARTAGARFLALLPQTDVSQALGVCERLRNGVLNYAFVGTPQGNLVLSVGLATYPDGRLESVGELVNAAEASLDRAKDGGGNRIETWHDPTNT